MNVPCDLCKKEARIRCGPDRASLCWDCDAHVHSANFLAARHFRKLLCSACQSPTAWGGRGSVLGFSVSICDGCILSAGEGKFRKEVEENQVVPSSHRRRRSPSSSCDDDCSSSDSATQTRRRVKPKLKKTMTQKMNPDRSEESDSCGEILTVDSNLELSPSHRFFE